MNSGEQFYGQVTLGLIHLMIGITIFVSRAVFDWDVIKWLSALIEFIPVWSLAVLGFVKSTYAIGAYFPGTTLILLYFLGHDCSQQESLTWIVLVWVGVLIGMALSYRLGRGISRVKDMRHFKLRDLVFAMHPNFVAIYFFELGYWRRPIAGPFLYFSFCGLTLLTVFTIGICTLKVEISGFTSEIGPVWATLIVLLGLYRIRNAVYT
jgi:hypothetical protein